MHMDDMSLLAHKEAHQLAKRRGDLLKAIAYFAVRPIAAVVAAWVARIASQAHLDSTRSALVLRGVRTQLEERPSSVEIDPDDKLRQELDRAEAKVAAQTRNFRVAAETLSASSSRSAATMRSAFLAASESADLLRNEIRRLGSAIRAHDANLYVMSKASCCTADALQQELQALID